MSIFFLALSVLIYAIVNGNSVMALELIAAKMIAPWYGNSLYTWGTILASSLGGLAIGYFIGGRWSEIYTMKKRSLKLVLIAILLTLYFFALPYFSSLFLKGGVKLGLLAGILISVPLWLGGGMLLLGLVSPLLISLLADRTRKWMTGVVYGISTSASVLAVWLYGFFLLPLYGIFTSTKITAIAFLCVGILFSLNYILFIRQNGN